MLLMWITKNTTVRSLIWLAAITVPVQGLPAASCGCTGGKTCCKKEQFKGCCCLAAKDREGRYCCAKQQPAATHSCCSKAGSGQDLACKCGFNCPCGKTSRQTPATPPVENNNQTEKAASDSLATNSVAIVDQLQITQRHQDASGVAEALTALDRCVSLCRFTL